jgi:hypothetical protein
MNRKVVGVSRLSVGAEGQHGVGLNVGNDRRYLRRALGISAVQRLRRGVLFDVEDLAGDAWGCCDLLGLTRMPEFGLLQATILTLLLLVVMVATETIESSLGFSVLAILVFLVFVSLGTVASVILFNRPSFAVPPHLRDQSGAVGEWRDARQRRQTSAR